MKICLVGAKVFHVDEQINMMKLAAAFTYFA